jgi:hypothetical protein
MTFFSVNNRNTFGVTVSETAVILRVNASTELKTDQQTAVYICFQKESQVGVKSKDLLDLIQQFSNVLENR